MSGTTSKNSHSGLQIVLLAGVTASTGWAIDLCLPALPFIAASLEADMGQVQQTLSVFILGVALGQLVYGPLSDRFGRKRVLIFGFVVFILGSILCASAQSVEQLVMFRLIQSLGVAVGAVVMRAVVRDLFQGERAAKVLSQMMLIMLTAPLIAPLLSAQLLRWFSWRVIFWLLVAIGLTLLAGVLLKLPETLPVAERREISLKTLPGQYLKVLLDRNTAGYFLCGTFTFAGMFAFVAGSPFVYIQYFGVPVEYFGFLYGSNVLMISLLSWLNSRVIEKVGLGPMLTRATWLSMLSGISVLFFALTGIGGLWGIYPSLVAFIGCLGLIAANSAAGMLDPYGKTAGVVSSVMGAGRFLFGFFASSMVGFFHNETPVPMAAIICASSVLAFLSYRFLVSGQPAAAIMPPSRTSVCPTTQAAAREER
jgi:DHA1 family bicyclomycin/chloramphenicol resistance-like MFS transporter